VAEDDPAEGARNEADRISEKRLDDRVVFAGALDEEQLVEDERGSGPVQEELVPLDDGAGHRGDDDPLQAGRNRALLMLRRR
jgi:hypothetical protein